MRVLFVTHAFPRYDGDIAGSFLLRLASALVHEGVSVRVLAPAAKGLPHRVTLDGVEVERFRYAPASLQTLAYTGNMVSEVRGSWGGRVALLGMLGAELFRTFTVAREFRADLIHAHWWFPNALAAGAASRLARVPIVTTFHGSDVRLARSVRLAQPILRHIMARSAAVTAVSGWLAREAHMIAPDSPEPMVAPMPVAIDLYVPNATERSETALLFVGRLSEQKGADILLHALTLLPAELSLDIVGDGEERSELLALAERFGIASRIRWHGAQPASTLAAYYRKAAAVVIPSLEEGLGLVAVEAQLCHAPVVAFETGGLPDVIEHDVTGILVRRRDSAALADAVRHLLARPDRGASLGTAGRSRSLALFAPSVVASRYVDIYRNALGRTNS